nr:alkaline phosphatase [uncultured Desulfobulbus sp.]
MNSKKICCVAAFAILTLSTSSVLAKTPKYVFFFVGDGMSSSQIQAAEAYLTTKNGGSATEATDLLKTANRLNMSQFPVLGMQTTYDAHALMTDSASAGTAFSCGLKTKSGVIGMDDTQTTSYKSIAQLADEKGKRVGVISSVSLDHATPAAFYASVASRGYMNSIATQMAESGYEFFGGGGLVAPTAENRSGDTNNNAWELLTDNDYTVLKTQDAIMDLKSNPTSKVVCINPYLQDAEAMPYAIDRPDSNVSLAEMTEVAISVLTAKNVGKKKEGFHSDKKRNAGFFLMVEGGKIDWACHANDAMAAIGDTLAFDDAVGVALAFYKEHPKDTLIVVTGDHETGGMTIGHATTGYTAYYDRLLNQKESFTAFAQNEWAAYKSAHSDGYDYTSSNNLSSSSEMLSLMSSVFGLDYDDLNDYQKEKLEDAFDKSMCGSNDNSDSENTLLYGSYEPIIVTITHILNERSSIGWTSYSHTGVPVPVFAIGAKSDDFAGFYDNTDIAKKFASAMGIKGTLPIERD